MSTERLFTEIACFLPQVTLQGIGFTYNPLGSFVQRAVGVVFLRFNFKNLAHVNISYFDKIEKIRLTWLVFCSIAIRGFPSMIKSMLVNGLIAVTNLK